MGGEAQVRGICERDEELIAEFESFASPEERTTALLARCVIRAGDLDRPDAGALRKLSVGMRERLLLEIRRRTFGERIECVQNCPACRKSMSLDFQVQDLLRLGEGRPPEPYEEIVSVDGTAFRIAFRLPTGEDLEYLADDSERTPAEAIQLLLTRCIADARCGENRVAAADLPDDVVSRLSHRMADLDPLAEIRMPVACPGCGYRFDAVFDTGEYLFHELKAWQSRLYREVHRIALAYHWREEDILRMNPRKRRIYLDLLAQECSQ